MYPAEVERILLESAAVWQAAVIGLPDERLGEVPGAFVVPAEGAQIDVSSLVAFLATRLANFKVRRRIWVVDPPSSQCGSQGGKGRTPFHCLFTSGFKSEGPSRRAPA